MDWIITAGLMAISLVLLLITLMLDARIRKLEKEMKADQEYKPRDLSKEEEAKDAIDRNYAAIEEKLIEYNESYGDPTYTEWIDKDFDSKGVK